MLIDLPNDSETYFVLSLNRVWLCNPHFLSVTHVATSLNCVTKILLICDITSIYSDVFTET